MEPGRVLRQRNIRDYGDNPLNYFEYRPDEERAVDLKRVFVTMVLGTEGYQIVNKKGEKVMAHLDTTRALNQIGMWGENQIEAVLGEKAVSSLHEHAAKLLEDKKKGAKNV